jgi:hypothetical protein
MKKS